MRRPFQREGECPTESRCVLGASREVTEVRECRTMRLFGAIIGAYLLSLWLPSSAVAQPKKEEVWHRAESAHFTFFSSLKESTTNRLAQKLETLAGLIATFDPQRRPLSPKPFIIYLFKNDKSLEPYYSVYDGKVRPLAWFSRGNIDATYVAVDATQWDNAAEGVYHLYAFDVIDSRFASLPPWLRYGLSEYYGTFKADQRKPRIGLPHSRSLEVMREQSTLPFEQVLTAKHHDPIVHQQGLATRFRAQAWSAVHYLIHGDKRPGQLARYIELLQRRRPESEAFAAAFEVTPQKMSAEMRAYAQGSRFEYSYVEPGSVNVDSSFTWTPVPWDEMLCRLGDLMLYSADGRSEEAAKYYRLALDKNPRQGQAYSGLGAIRQEAKDYSGSIQPLGKAIELSPDNYRAHLLYALGRMGSHEIEGKSWDELSEASIQTLTAARESYRTCTDLEPEHVECWLGLGRTYNWDLDPSDGIVALDRALILAPAREHAALGLMNFYSILGATQEVRQLLDAYSSLLDPDQLADAKRYVSRARENANAP